MTAKQKRLSRFGEELTAISAQVPTDLKVKTEKVLHSIGKTMSEWVREEMRKLVKIM